MRWRLPRAQRLCDVADDSGVGVDCWAELDGERLVTWCVDVDPRTGVAWTWCCTGHDLATLRLRDLPEVLP